MHCIPKQQNERGVNLILACTLLSGGVCYAAPVFAERAGVTLPSLPFSVATVIFIVAAVFVLVRYKMTGFRYSVVLKDERDSDRDLALVSGISDTWKLPTEYLDFVVRRRQGARMEVMECVLGMSDLVDVVPLSKDGESKKSVKNKYSLDGFVFYDYTLTLGLLDPLELIFVDGNRYVGVIIEPDEQFRDYFMKFRK